MKDEVPFYDRPVYVKLVSYHADLVPGVMAELIPMAWQNIHTKTITDWRPLDRDHDWMPLFGIRWELLEREPGPFSMIGIRKYYRQGKLFHSGE